MTKLKPRFNDFHLKDNSKGFKQGLVVDNDDPLKQGRIKVKIPEILESDDTENLPWCYPEPNNFNVSNNQQFLMIPEIGDTVEINFRDNDYYKPYYTGQKAGTNFISEVFKEDYPNSRGFVFALNEDNTEIGWFKVNKAKGQVEIKIGPSTQKFTLSNNTLVHEVTGDYFLKVGGNYNIEVAGNILEKANAALRTTELKNAVKTNEFDIDTDVFVLNTKENTQKSNKTVIDSKTTSVTGGKTVVNADTMYVETKENLGVESLAEISMEAAGNVSINGLGETNIMSGGVLGLGGTQVTLGSASPTPPVPEVPESGSSGDISELIDEQNTEVEAFEQELEEIRSNATQQAQATISKQEAAQTKIIDQVEQIVGDTGPDKEEKAPSVAEQVSRKESILGNVSVEELGDVGKIIEPVEEAIADMTDKSQAWTRIMKTVTGMQTEILEVTTAAEGFFVKAAGLVTAVPTLTILNQIACILEALDKLISELEDLVARIAALRQEILDLIMYITNFDNVINALLNALSAIQAALNDLMANRKVIISCNGKPIGPKDIIKHQLFNLPVAKAALKAANRFLQQSKTLIIMQYNQLRNRIRNTPIPLLDTIESQARAVLQQLRTKQIEIHQVWEEFQEILLPYNKPGEL